jgi:fumarylacetoacetate (FAA) hydrolase
MKFASLKDGTRDGAFVVVSRDLTQAVEITDLALTMQHALEDWDEIAPNLEKVYGDLNNGKIKDTLDFTKADLMAPLPRSYQWLDGSAYVNHVELVRKARGADMPESFWTDPLMYQGASDNFIGPHDDIDIADEAWGVDFESEIAVITTDVPMGIPVEEAEKYIRLILLVNDISLRNLIPAELAKGFGFLHGKPATSFSPVAVTPDELGTAWHDGKVHLPLITTLNGIEFGRPNAGVDMTFNFPQLIAHAAKTRHLGVGTIIGSGTVSNIDRSTGSSCLAEKRMLEMIDHGSAKTPFLHFGDRVRIEMNDASGHSIFGAIDQTVCKYVLTNGG